MKWLLTMCLVFAPVVVEAGVFSMSDSTFPDSNWAAISLPGSAAWTAGQRATGGNPGSYRAYEQTTGDFTGLRDTFTTATYNPGAFGAINMISISFDYGPGSRVGVFEYMPVLLQGGQAYGRIGGYAIAETVWRSLLVTSTSATDWALMSGAAGTPDFSAGGGPIDFAMEVTTSAITTPCTSPCITGGLDNFEVTVTYKDRPADVPEPAGGLAVAVVGVGMVMVGRRR